MGEGFALPIIPTEAPQPLPHSHLAAGAAGSAPGAAPPSSSSLTPLSPPALSPCSHRRWPATFEMTSLLKYSYIS